MSDPGGKRAEERYTSIGLAQAAGCTRKALRLYQARGLIPPPKKRWASSYDARIVDRLRLVVALRNAGLSIEGIAALLGTRGGNDVGEMAERALSDLLGRIDDRVEELRHVQRELAAARAALAACAACELPRSGCAACIESKALEAVTRGLLALARLPEDG